MILLQIKQPPIQRIFLFVYKESEKVAYLHHPLEIYPGDEGEKVKVLD